MPENTLPPPPRTNDSFRPRAALLALAATVAGTLLPPAVVLLSGHTLAWRDTARLIGSLRPAIEGDLRAGRLPLWSAHEALGMPLLAQLMHGVLHPVSLAAALVAPGAPMDVQIVLYLALASAGAWFLARRLGASPWAAAVAGLAYGLSGYVLGMTCVLTYLAGAASAPWTVAGLRAAGEGRRGIVAAALGIALVLLSGEPQWALVSGALGVVLAHEAGRGLGVARAAIGGGIGALVAGVQLVPALVFLPETARAAGLGTWERALWALAPWRMLELVVPGLFNGVPGSGVAEVFRALGGDVGRHTTSFVPSVFVGIVPLALAALAIPGSRLGRALAATAAVLLWLALGVHAGADALLHRAPVWGAFRYSEKLVGPVTLCVAVLAALGADRLARAAAPRLRAAIVATAGATGLLLLVVVVPGGERVLTSIVSDETAPVLRARLGIGLAHLAAGIALVAAIGALARRLGRRIVPGAAAAAVFASGAGAAVFALHAGNPGVVDPAPVRALARDGELVRIATPVTGAPIRGHEDLDPADRLAALESRLGAAPYPAAIGVDQLDCYSGFSSIHFDRLVAALERDLGDARWAAWRRLGLSHVAAQRALRPDQVSDATASIAGGVKVHEDPFWGYAVWEVPHRPFAAFAPGAVAAASDQEAYADLVALVSQDRPEVVVEGAPPAGTAPGRVLGFERGGGRVRIVAEADGDALLVLNDAWWPGWTAHVDGHPVPILRADVLVRAVPFPPGRHVLEMRYAPPEVRWGIAVSAIGVAALALAAWAGRRRGRRDASESVAASADESAA